MRNILLIGAGRSSSYLVRYLLENAKKENWTLTVGDVSVDVASRKINGHPDGRAIHFDIQNEVQRSTEISRADLVISMLPASMHMPVALACVKNKKHLVTASYVSDEMHMLNKEAESAGILLLNECGLDPGIDHMSCMQEIDKIKAEGGILSSFKSYTGGLVAPESNDNPWGYKFSWNPRNVILAGQGTARYIEKGEYKYIPYNRLFAHAETIAIAGLGKFDGYANRDSLAYRKIYGLEHIPTMLRGTLRQEGYCRAWNVFVQLGMTDDSYPVEDSEHLTYEALVRAFLPKHNGSETLRQRLAHLAGLNEKDKALDLIEWTGILEDQPIGLKSATPAIILQQLLEQKWKLKESDKDMIVMQHLFGYTRSGKEYSKTSSLVVKGENDTYTAMARTVGLPVAIAAKNILSGRIRSTGVRVPVEKEIYEPVMEELGRLGISFQSQEKVLA